MSRRRSLTILALAALASAPLGAQARATATTSCTVRILPQAARGYDPSTEVQLSGTVARQAAPWLWLRLPAGLVRVETGAGLGELTPGMAVQVVASRQVQGTGQVFVAREVQVAGHLVRFRDARGVPVQL